MCRVCASGQISDAANAVIPDEVHPQSDPTICGDCRTDFGDKDLPVLQGRHLCSECRSHRKRKQFPLRMKVAFLICGLGGAWCYVRSIQIAFGVHAYRNGVLAFKERRYSDAEAFLGIARSHMPEDEWIQSLDAFYKGHASLSHRHAKEAAIWFQKSLDLDPNSEATALMVLIAKRRVAIEAMDIPDYFRTSEAILELEGRTPQALLTMASAWACRFAQSGKVEFRDQAMTCLEQARKLGTHEIEDADWIEAWVKQIIETRTIVSFDEYWYSLGKGQSPEEDWG